MNFLKHLVVFTFRIPSVKTINGSKEFNVNLTKITEKKNTQLEQEFRTIKKVRGELQVLDLEYIYPIHGVSDFEV